VVRLADLTTLEVGEGRVLVVPIGSTEQHGPHLPLDTDTVIATTVAERAAAAVPEAVVAPPIAIGAAGEHAGFAGTLSIGTEVMASVIVEIVRTAGPEFGRVVLVNGHGGNVAAVRSAVERCADEGRSVAVWHPARVGGDAHAGATETSVMLALDPSRVRLDRVEPGVTAPLAEIIGELRAGGLAAVSQNGVLGDPTTADATEGEAILAEWVGQVVALLRS
jgi:creatinine amidohydrolase